MELSVIIPVYNEENNVAILHSELINVLNSLNKKFEIIFVDDGSADKTLENLSRLKKVKIIKLRRNFGQTAALLAGINNANGKVIITLDGDLQNNPKDIPRLLEKLDKGYDVVSGWRKNRNDKFSKKFFSFVANRLRRVLINERIHDSGCSLKAYKKECFNDIDLYGEMHRYIPALLGWKGFRIAEVEVNHRYRKYGKTKYGVSRVLKGFLDLLNILFWRKFSNRPLHLFGGFGLLMSFVGGLFLSILIVLRFFGKISLGQSQLPLLAVLLIVLGVQFFVSGLLADIAVKNYQNTRNNKSSNIERIIEK